MTPQQVLEKAREARLVAMMKLAEEWAQAAGAMVSLAGGPSFYDAQDARNKAREALREAIRTLIDLAEGVQQEPVARPIIWYMRDNHTFLSLPLDAARALEMVKKEFDAGYTCGMLCSKHPDLPGAVHGHGKDKWSVFEQEAKAWLDKAQALAYPASPAATPPQPAVPELPQAAEARMLTDGELDACCGRFHDPALVRRIQRKFAEVNNIAIRIAAGTTTPKG